MVQALHAMGLSVVFDTVYNHTFHSGTDGTPGLAALDHGGGGDGAVHGDGNGVGDDDEGVLGPGAAGRQRLRLGFWV